MQRGTWDRFPAILMTAVVTAVAVLPLALIGDVPGIEILARWRSSSSAGLSRRRCSACSAVPAMYLLFTPSRAADLEDLGMSLVGEQELRESIATVALKSKKNLIQPKSILINRYGELIPCVTLTL